MEKAGSFIANAEKMRQQNVRLVIIIITVATSLALAKCLWVSRSIAHPIEAPVLVAETVARSLDIDYQRHKPR